MIVEDPDSPILNMPHSMSLVFYETNIRYIIGFATSPYSTKITPENIGQLFIKLLMSSQLSVHEYTMVNSFLL